MWRSVKRWLISEGFEELSKMVLLLHGYALQSLSSSEPVVFLRPYLRILGTSFTLSQARKKFQSRLNFSLADFDGIIQLVERERVPDHGTRLLALTSILESQPPACFSFQVSVVWPAAAYAVPNLFKSLSCIRIYYLPQGIIWDVCLVCLFSILIVFCQNFDPLISLTAGKNVFA